MARRMFKGLGGSTTEGTRTRDGGIAFRFSTNRGAIAGLPATRLRQAMLQLGLNHLGRLLRPPVGIGHGELGQDIPRLVRLLEAHPQERHRDRRAGPVCARLANWRCRAPTFAIHGILSA